MTGACGFCSGGGPHGRGLVVYKRSMHRMLQRLSGSLNQSQGPCPAVRSCEVSWRKERSVSGSGIPYIILLYGVMLFAELARTPFAAGSSGRHGTLSASRLPPSRLPNFFGVLRRCEANVLVSGSSCDDAVVESDGNLTPAITERSDRE